MAQCSYCHEGVPSIEALRVGGGAYHLTCAGIEGLLDDEDWDADEEEER